MVASIETKVHDEKQFEQDSVHDNNQKSAKDAEQSMEDLKKIIGNLQKRANEAEAALDMMKKMIGAILNASKSDLKEMCDGENIKVYRRPGMKHKYACALLQNFWRNGCFIFMFQGFGFAFQC